MHPEISLNTELIAGNLKAWRTFAAVPVRPVLKCNAYNWGCEQLIPVLDPLCDTYCVSDFEELMSARRFTRHPIAVLTSIPQELLASALDANAIPTISNVRELDTVLEWSSKSGRRPRIRVGVLPATGWSGIQLAAIEELAPALAAAQLDIEVWTHITDPEPHAARKQRSRLKQAVHTIRGAGGRVVGSDIASTYSLANLGAMGDAVRIGIGLFGSTAGASIRGVRCALRVVAPVLRAERLPAGTKVGYGNTKLLQDGYVLTVRCGYGDGLPKSLAGTSDILSVGMQYATMRPPRQPFEETHVALLDEKTDLDAFAAEAGQSPHEVVTAFGNAKAGAPVLI